MRVVAVSRSEVKGQKKFNIDKGILIEDYGLSEDAHAGGGDRQLSLLALESIEKMRALGVKVKPGDFAENITTQGIILHTLPLGTRFLIGVEIELELTRIGKKCHSGCAIAKEAGKCIMPLEGVFCRVIHGGEIKPGDTISLIS